MIKEEIFTQETKTPIEIALQIDENGMTTASKLYLFLELDNSHFSRWCNKNIIKNKFALENEDYIPFAIDGERHNPKPKTDYKLASEFAKKLSMTGNTDKHEQARQYFDCTRSVLYSNIYKKLEDTYDLDLNELQEEYCYENLLLKEETYPMDVIEHNKQMREVTTLLVDSLLIKCGLQTDEEVKHLNEKLYSILSLMR